jgi:iron(III) transport system ATP-binding protein
MRYSMILIKNLQKGYPSGRVIENLSLTVSEGKTVVINGASGSGKTTLLRLIAGMERPNGGEIFLEGKQVNSAGEMIPPYLRSIGFVFQSPTLFPHMTVGENVRFSMPEMPEEKIQLLIDDLFRYAGISHIIHKSPLEISGGEAQRVSILRALAAQSRYLLLDEPFTDLDPELKQRMISLVKDHIRTHGTTTILVTHDREDIIAMDAPVLEMDPRLDAVI